MSIARSVALRAALAVVGAVLCVASLAAHRHLWTPAGIDLPWGLVLSLGATYLGVRAAGLLDGAAVGALCCAIGWVGVLLYLFGGRTEGDYLIAADWLGYSMLGGGLAAAAAGVFVSMAGPPSAAPGPRPSI
ncbi:MAG: DUF6113 family protein [Nocardioidaceae bacterium]